MILVLQSSLCIGDIASTTLSISSTEGAFIVSKNTSEGRGSPCAADLVSKSAVYFLLLGCSLQRNLQKRLPTFELHLDTFQASGLLP